MVRIDSLRPNRRNSVVELAVKFYNKKRKTEIFLELVLGHIDTVNFHNSNVYPSARLSPFLKLHFL